MSGQSPTKRLREAARVLRERAEDATPGPWRAAPTSEAGWAEVLWDDPDVLEAMAHAHYRSQWPAIDDWAEGTDVWRDLHRADMHVALDVLRARIEET